MPSCVANSVVPRRFRMSADVDHVRGDDLEDQELEQTLADGGKAFVRAHVVTRYLYITR